MKIKNFKFDQFEKMPNLKDRYKELISLQQINFLYFLKYELSTYSVIIQADPSNELIFCVALDRVKCGDQNIPYIPTSMIFYHPTSSLLPTGKKKCRKRSKTVKLRITKPISYCVYLPDQIENYLYRVTQEGIEKDYLI